MSSKSFSFRSSTVTGWSTQTWSSTRELSAAARGNFSAVIGTA